MDFSWLKEVMPWSPVTEWSWPPVGGWPWGETDAENVEEATFVLREVTIGSFTRSAEILGIDPDEWRENPRKVVEDGHVDESVETMQRFVDFVVDKEESDMEVPDLASIPYTQAYLFFIVVYSRWSNGACDIRSVLTSALEESSRNVVFQNGMD